MRAIDLAVSAGRKRQSPRTGFVHLFASDDSALDTIPIYENFCFALALFRQKTADTVLEGKNLIERLLAFQADDGNFPVYLHDFPKCWDFHLGAKIVPALRHVLQDFGLVLGAEYKAKLEAALAKIRHEASIATPKSADEWFHWIAADQLHRQNGIYPIPWNAEIQVFTGDSLPQERGEPQPQAIEYILAEKTGFNKRLLRDHPNQIRSALLFPFSSSQEQTVSIQEVSQGLLWKGETVHSLYAPQTVFALPAEIDLGKNDVFEVVSYCDISPETSIFINGQKGMVFHFGDVISIRTPARQIDLRFELIEGAGDFCGHISRANRPGCLGKGHEAFDWQIGLRTLRRQGACKIELQVKTAL